MFPYNECLHFMLWFVLHPTNTPSLPIDVSLFYMFCLMQRSPGQAKTSSKSVPKCNSLSVGNIACNYTDTHLDHLKFRCTCDSPFTLYVLVRTWIDLSRHAKVLCLARISLTSNAKLFISCYQHSKKNKILASCMCRYLPRSYTINC